MNHTFGTLILAGGKSERMLFPKSHLMYKGKTFLENIAEGYCKSGVNNICLIIRKDHCEGNWKEKFEKARPYFSSIIKIDSSPGRSHSLKLGLRNFSGVDFCFIHNVDNPFINTKTIRLLQENKNAEGYTTAFYKRKGGHPLLVSKKIISLINTMQEADYDFRKVLKKFPRQDTEIKNHKILLNINTPEDYNNCIANRNYRDKYL